MDAARVFHEATNHAPGFPRDPRQLRSFQRDVLANAPLTFKEYGGLPTIQLELARPSADAPPAVAVLTQLRDANAELTAERLARILAFSAGITRVIDRGPHAGRKRYMRAASSAHSYPDVYVVTGPLEGVTAGVYYFHGLHLTLTRLREGDFRAVLAAATADASIARRPASVVIVGVPWRAAWHYGERALRHVYWDTGGLLANMVAVASADGVPARVALAFVDAEVARLVGADRAQQFPVAVAAFGIESAAVSASPPVPTLTIADPPLTTGTPTLFPLVRDAHAAGDLETADAVTKWRGARTGAGTRAPAIDVATPSGHDRTLEEVILWRGSARRMRLEPLPRVALEWPLRVATRPAPGDWLDDTTALLDHIAVVHAIEGLDAGVYRLGASGLELVRRGDFRQEARHVSLDQAQGGDAAYTTFHFADLDRITRALGARGYRAAQVEGGYVLEMLHLAAYALGVGATGLTFFDEAAASLCGMTSALMTEVAVGKPAYRAKRGGLGAQATTIQGRAFELYMERMRELGLG
jgi:SagB-type dehydrogenase family enzyme